MNWPQYRLGPLSRRNNPAPRYSLLRFFVGALLLLPFGAGPVRGATETGPGVALFPVAVRENIRFTQEAAAGMERNLEEIVGDLDAQMAAYRRSQCDGADDDPGCRQISSNIATTFRTMLESLETSLPEMQRAVRQTHETLGARLADEVGRKMTARGLQHALQSSRDGAAGSGSAVQPRSRMSRTFQRYYDLIRTQRDQELTTLAAQIYLDTHSSLHYMELIDAEVKRGIVTLDLEQFLGEVTPEMVNTVDGVKALLFGAQPDDGVIAGPPRTPEPATFESPWELGP